MTSITEQSADQITEGRARTEAIAQDKCLNCGSALLRPVVFKKPFRRAIAGTACFPCRTVVIHRTDGDEFLKAYAYKDVGIKI